MEQAGRSYRSFNWFVIVPADGVVCGTNTNQRPSKIDSEKMTDTRRNKLLKWMKALIALSLAGILFVVIDYSFNQAGSKSYRFQVEKLEFNSPVLLKQGSLLVLVARYDEQTLYDLNRQGRLAGISQSFRQESKRVDENGYFVALGYGTQSNCPLLLNEDYYQESCSEARYDLLGRSTNQQAYTDLKIPQYSFNNDYSLLSIE